jgi:hypothetical protein
VKEGPAGEKKGSVRGSVQGRCDYYSLGYSKVDPVCVELINCVNTSMCCC